MKFRSILCLPFFPFIFIFIMSFSFSIKTAEATAVNIGTLGGDYSQAYAINNSGSIVGDSTLVPGSSVLPLHAFLWNGTMTDLGTLGGDDSSQAFAINNNGQIVGWSAQSGSDYWSFSNGHAVMWQNGAITDLGPGVAISINNAGVVAGNDNAAGYYGGVCPYGNYGPNNHAFIWQNGIRTDLGAGVAVAINNSGLVLIDDNSAYEMANTTGTGHSYIWNGTGMIDLGTLGGSLTGADAMNDLGQVAGQSTTATGEVHGFFWQNGVMTDLGVNVWPAAINNEGQVTGSGPNGAFIWQNGVMQYLAGVSTGSEGDTVDDTGLVMGNDWGTNWSSQVQAYISFYPYNQAGEINLAPIAISDVPVDTTTGSTNFYGGPNGGPYSTFTQANAMNNSGVAAGISSTSAGFAQATLWENGSLPVVTPLATPGGIINSSMSETVMPGSTVPFTVTPDTGYSISSVTGCGGTLSGNTYTTGPVTSDCTVSAAFAISTYTISTVVSGSGTISPAPASVEYNGTTSFTVTPNQGYGISSVTGCGGALSGNIYTTGPITADCSVTATFVINTYTVTSAAGSNGTISPASQAINYVSTSSFTVTPNTGYHISSVADNCGAGGSSSGTLSGNTYTTGPVTSNCSVTAMFEINTYTVTPSAGIAGSANNYQYLTQWGSQGTGNGQFGYMEGVAVDANSNVYVADSGNNRVQKFDPNGNYLAQWISDGIGLAFNSPNEVAVDATGDLYVSDLNNNRIVKFGPSGNYLTQWGSLGTGDGMFNGPGAMAFDPSGNIYVTDWQNNRVQKFDPNGNYLSQWSYSGWTYGPWGIAIDASGDIYIANGGNTIQKFDSNGNLLTQWTAPLDTQNNGGVWDLAIDAQGNIYANSWAPGSGSLPPGNNGIMKFDSNGNYLAMIGSTGTGNGQFIGTEGVAVNAAGDLYVGDDSYRIQEFQPVYNGACPPEGCINPQTPVAVASGGTTQFTVTPAPGYYVSGVTGCMGTLSGNVYTTGPVTADCYVNASFSAWPSSFTISASAGAGGSISPSGQVIVLTGSSQTFTITPAQGYYTTGVQVDGVYQGAVGSYTFSSVYANHTISATFAIAPVITSTAGPDGSISPSGSIPVPNGSIQSFTVTPATGYYISSVTGCGGTLNGNIYTTGPVTSDCTVSTSFAVYTYTVTPSAGTEGVSSTYQLENAWGSSGYGNGQFGWPVGAAVDAAGNVYVTDWEMNNVQKFDRSGNFLAQWGYNGNGTFLYPLGIAADGQGNIYVADSQRVQKFDSNGNLLAHWSSWIYKGISYSFASQSGGTPWGVAVDGFGNIYVTDADHYRVVKFDPNGNCITQWGSWGSGNGQFEYVKGIAVDNLGNVYVSDDYRVQKFDPNGNYLTQWSVTTGNWGGLAIDGSGDIYVSDSNGLIDKYDTNGNFLAQWSAANAGLIAADSSGNIYVPQGFNQARVAEFQEVYNGTSSAGGSINPAAPQIMAYNGITSFTVTPNTGYHISGVTGCGGILNGPIYTTGPVIANCTVSASFVTNTYTVTGSAVGNGTISPASQIAIYNTPGAFTVTPVTGYHISSITDNCGAGGSSSGTLSGSTYTTGPVTSNCSVTAAFAINTYTVTGSAVGNGTISPASQTAIYNTSGAFTVTPVTGYHITSVTDNCGAGGASSGTLSGNTYTTGPITFDCTVSASFAINTYTVTPTAGIAGSANSYQYLTQWGSYGTGNGQFNQPEAVAVSLSGEIYVADGTNHRIEVFDSNGNYLRQWGSYGSANGQFIDPFGLAVDASGDVYVADSGNNRVQKFDPNGSFIMNVCTYGSGNGYCAGPRGVAVDSSGNIYVADFGNNLVQKFNPSGGFITQWSVFLDPYEHWWGPNGIAVDNTSGHVYVIDYHMMGIDTFDENGNFLNEWYADRVVGIALDGQGNLYASQPWEVDIAKINPDAAASGGSYTSGLLATIGSAGAGPGQFGQSWLTKVAVDAGGSVYVNDYVNNRIEKYGEVYPGSSSNGGSISPSTPMTVAYGSTTQFTVTPAPGYYISSVTGCSMLNGTTAGPVTANCTLSASFALRVPPTITATVSPLPNSNGWNNTNATVSFACSGGSGGVASCPAPVTVATEGANQKVCGTATDNEGDTASACATLNIDRTPPTVTATAASAPNSYGWNNTGITVSFSCSDSLSGIASCPTPVTVATEGANQNIAGTATDMAGNTASSSAIVSIDETPPVIAITGITNGATYDLGLNVPTASYTATDALSGVATSSASLTGGDGLGLGTFTYTVTASDKAGNATAQSAVYNIIATTDGTSALINQYFSSGAITSSDVYNSLLSDLIAAKTDYNSSNSSAGNNKMQSFIKLVQAQNGKSISSQAAAVLIDCANYIISHS
ncbi:MAG: SMP-30/gluconolactonase/LRE family protein [Actinomycetota bacterium]|nr:SMP-30/gluconolactonase/LRE family protein [Actinomycetota bacterium]